MTPEGKVICVLEVSGALIDRSNRVADLYSPGSFVGRTPRPRRTPGPALRTHSKRRPTRASAAVQGTAPQEALPDAIARREAGDLQDESESHHQQADVYRQGNPQRVNERLGRSEL